ncbi:hypothetical protein [Microbacterium oleivorans]|nr:hypothetical protein [Microbacterium oleivorans]
MLSIGEFAPEISVVFQSVNDRIEAAGAASGRAHEPRRSSPNSE